MTGMLLFFFLQTLSPGLKFLLDNGCLKKESIECFRCDCLYFGRYIELHELQE